MSEILLGRVAEVYIYLYIFVLRRVVRKTGYTNAGTEKKGEKLVVKWILIARQRVRATRRGM